MKVYTVTQTDEEGQWTGLSVYGTAKEAVDSVNEEIEEHNEFLEDGEQPVNRILWDERRGNWRYTLGFYTYHFKVHELNN